MVKICDKVSTHLCMFLSLQAGILMGEVTGIWPEIRKQIEDPFLVRVRRAIAKAFSYFQCYFDLFFL